MTITSTTDERGYYLGSDGSYYAAVTANDYGAINIFSTGAGIENGVVYYFKVEPIRWRILSENDETAFILCDSIIDCMAYQSSVTKIDGVYYTTANGAPDGTFANNYKYSEVRRWLNNNFYNTVFAEYQQQVILTALVDNSVPADNPNGCEDTEDKIFILSSSEVNNDEYGLFISFGGTIEEYQMQNSDYCRAIGGRTNSETGNGDWWLRTPESQNTKGMHGIGRWGNTSMSADVSVKIVGVVPAMWIKLI